MKKKVILLVAVVIPASLFLNVWQAFRYQMVEKEVAYLEGEQQIRLENNKKVIVGIEVLGAPSRIDGIAADTDGLVKPDNPSVIRIVIENGGGDG